MHLFEYSRIVGAHNLAKAFSQLCHFKMYLSCSHAHAHAQTGPETDIQCFLYLNKYYNVFECVIATSITTPVVIKTTITTKMVRLRAREREEDSGREWKKVIINGAILAKCDKRMNERTNEPTNKQTYRIRPSNQNISQI